MSQRNSANKTPESTSLRRSSRLLQLNHSPKTPIPISNNKISSRKSQIRSRNPTKSAINLKECVNGSEIRANSANGSTRKSNFGNGFVGIRRSLRLCNEVTSSLVDVHVCSRSSSRLKKVPLARIDSLEMNDFVDSPVTPIVNVEKKCRYVNGECSNGEKTGLIVSGLGVCERRVTRSCAKQLGGNVEIKEVEKSGLKNRNLFDSRADGGVGAKGRNVKRSLVCALGIARCGPLSPCATPQIGRRSRRYSRKDMDGVKGKNGDLDECIDGNFKRRITRGSSKRVGKESDLCGQDRKRGDTSMPARNEIGNGDAGKVMKKFRRTGREKRVKQAPVTSFSDRLEVEEAALRDVGMKEKESQECGKKDGDKSKNSGADITPGTKLVGVKRKRKEAGLQGKDQGWTNEQESALQRAYFAAKPSPHFWKRVSKLVPGKSAQECFDKVHSVNPTPPSNRYSSRLKKHNSPSEFLLKSDDLLKSIPAKSKNHGKSKQRSHLAHKNVRHLLRKFCQDSKPDLFSILEPSGNSLIGTPNLKAVQLTPMQSLGSPGFPSSGRHKKSVSRFSGLRRSPFTSPPVLKKVKNMALHDKYIDQLHVREGKRKAVSSRYLKSLQCQKNGTQNNGQKNDVIKAAKDALVSEARDVIEKFQQSQTNLMEAYSDSEEVLLSDNDEDDMQM
ncbi:uncharacterized protein LOC141599284 [Silene latifolia]|uniref:uncharacterized protein LOC141599284 n=1 Tax=Silene latifolia TaxID=37657 RepID=UPI003D778EF7